MKRTVEGKEVACRGKIFRTARMRHEWCEFVDDPRRAVEELRNGGAAADLFTFVLEIGDQRTFPEYRREPASASVLTITTHEKWFTNLDFKVRNKIRKAQKSGVELRELALDDDFAKGVEGIYNESPIRQGRKFWHYGKKWDVIKAELSSLAGHSIFVGAYHEGAMIGFMKLYQGPNVLRTVHILAKISQRDKPVQDALISKAVEICDQRKLTYLQYGSWATGGLGAFRMKHGFERMELPRFFAPLTWRGKLMLRLNLHHPLRERLPQGWVETILGWRNRWNSVKYGPA